ncbi:MAG: rhodanese-like domain-containing protein [Actinomycetota bacterium]|jgi:rhodanese-related sulfurtransferase
MPNEPQPISAIEANELLSSGALLLDVRENDEWDAGHSAVALHIPLAEVPDRWSEIPNDQIVVCVCRVGGRSARAAEFLFQQGYDTRNLAGGMLAWEEAGLAFIAADTTPRII